jgi:hypothetical protein
MHKEDIENNLVILGLDWGWSFNPIWLFREVKLSAEEERLLDEYSCRDAECFMPG